MKLSCNSVGVGISIWAKLVIISSTVILLCAKVSFLYNELQECIIVVYKHVDSSLHVESLDLTCMQNIRPIPLKVLEILGFKLKNKSNDKKNGEMDFCRISHVSSPILNYIIIL